MIKKWSYVAAAMLTAASGLALTSCIDNDEPYGIEQIRLATANLLDAKKAALEAAQANEQARIEIEKLQVEILKAQAEAAKVKAESEAEIARIEAEAAKLEAEARAAVDNARAEELLAQADLLKAQAEDQRAKTEAYIADQQATLNEKIALAAINVADAQRIYDEAMYRFEQEKNRNTDKANYRLYKAWEKAFEAYFKQLGIVNYLTEQYLATLQDYNKFTVDLQPVVVNGVITGWTCKNYEGLAILEKNVKDAQADIAFATEQIEKYQGFITDLENVKASDLYQLYEKYEEEAKANLAAWADAKAELDAVDVNNKELVDEIADLKAQEAAYNSQKIEIPAYTWDPKEIDEAAFASIGLTESVEIVAPRTSYTLGDNFTLPATDPKASNYTKAEDAYESLINNLKNYLLDANDVLWTQATINELKNSLKQQQTDFEELKAKWENAKKAYNMGNTPDYSVIPMEADVEAAVKAFNDAATSLTALRQAFLDADKEWEEALQKAGELAEAYETNPNSAANKLQAATDAYDDAIEANQAAYDKAIDAAQEVYDNTVQAALNTYKAMKRDEDAKKEIYEETKKANNNDETVKAVKDAKDAYDKAKVETGKALDKWVNAPAAALKVQTASNLEAKVAFINANKKAEDAYATAQETYGAAAADEAKDPVAKEWLAAEVAAEEAAAKRSTALTALVDPTNKMSVDAKLKELKDVCYEQSDEVGGWDLQPLSDLQTAYDKFIVSNDDLELPVAEAPSHYVVAGAYVNVKAYLINTSTDAYGELGIDYDPHLGSWDIDRAFLLDAADINKALVNEYIQEIDPEASEFDYPQNYGRFGAYGQILLTENRIDVGTAMLANQQLLSESIEPLKEGLAALQESKETAEEGLKEITYAKEDKEDELKAIKDELKAKVQQFQVWDGVYAKLLADLSATIALVEENVDLKVYPEMVDGDIQLATSELIGKYIKESIEYWENEIKYLEDLIDGQYAEALKKAEYMLQQYVDNEGILTANPKEADLARAEADLNAAKEKCALLKAIADELEAKYKEATK